MKNTLIVAAVCLALVIPATAAEPSNLPPFVAAGTKGMVASDCAYASQAGCKILQAGGNAMDAAVATSLALSVTRQFSSGLGGGGFFMVRLAKTGEVFALDYRECAPGAATADMFVKARAAAPDGPPPSQLGGLAPGVPGLLAGHNAIIQRFGTKPLSELIEPARQLAADGFTADESFADSIESARSKIQKYAAPAWSKAFRDGLLAEDIKVGSVVRQPELAAALELIAKQGIREFYQGRIADALVQTVKDAGGIITREDLARYQPTWREPLHVRYRDRFEVLLMPPPSSGGVAIAEILNILEHWDLADAQRRDPSLAAHLTVEAMKHAMADRARLLGDTDFAQVPIAELISKQHADKLAQRIRLDRVSEPDRYGKIPPEDAGTTHFSVVDQWGNVVSVTETINTEWGSLVMVKPWGFVLNNEMDDFSAEPERANAYNLQQSAANAVAAYKKPLSCMSPSIVLENGKPILAVGASGGPRIITATVQVILKVVDYGLPLAEAVAGPRLHHQWQPDEVNRNEYPADDAVVVGLKQRGHSVSDQRRRAIVQAVKLEGGRLVGASDPRKGGIPAGY